MDRLDGNTLGMGLMTIAFSTDQLDERDRIPFWVDVASKAFYAHDFEAKPTAFAGRLSAGTMDVLSLARCDCGPCSVSRTRRDAARDDIDDLLLCIRFEGRSRFSQGDRTIIMEPGTVVFHDAARPLKIDFLEQTRSLVIAVPRHLIESRIGAAGIERVTSVKAPATGMLVEFARALADRVEQMEPALHRRMSEQFIDLVSLAFVGDASGAPSTAREVALRRLKGEIERRLGDPALSPSSAAEAAGISVRYANVLLAGENTSLERYIVQRRLEQCRRALADPLQAHRMIGEIAYGWGFSDHSHFTRRFREAFGVTPGDYRQKTLIPRQ